MAQSSSAGASRRGAGALSVSVLAHGLVIVAALVLIPRTTPPLPLPDVTVALEFVQQPAAPVAPFSPPSPEPAAAEPPSPPQTEPEAPAAEANVDQPPPPDVPPAEPTPAPPPPPAPAESPPQAMEPKPEPPPPTPAPRPVRPATPRRAFALHPHSPAPETANAPAVSQAAAAAALLLPAHPVAGMESDRPPAYPEQARRRGQQGRVLLQVNVSAQGQPVEVTVAQSSGFASLDDAALRAVRQWRFVPATRGGTPVPAVAEVPVRFRLTE